MGHTKEPWEVSRWIDGRGGSVPMVGAGAATVAKMHVAATTPEADAEANADRIVACVNALEGLNPEGVARLLEACKWALYANGRRSGKLLKMAADAIAMTEEE